MSGNPDNGQEEPEVRRLFLQALELPTAQERQHLLDQACGTDSHLRAKVEGLLHTHRDDDFLECPAQEALEGCHRASKVAASEKPGDYIGRYKLLDKIGEGGCGVVYVAEQEQPVRRQVALKVIKLGMDTRQVVARFEAERQALALMDHPNIAKVLDAGTTDSGRPYFVMELVKGIRITRFCDEHTFSTEQRLDLFVQVCQAIQHAHQKGIIHRDIKPSNVLVADHDGVAVPKVIDFGIAKATTDQRLTDKTIFTAFEQFVGTPAYMSPEQARLSGQDVDTRSDIYGLGVLLYELLTGKTPFEAKRLVESGLDEIRRIIREEDPLRPSTKVHTLDALEQTTVARCRQTEPPKLVQRIRGDLDCIVLKCLEKDRTRRYETANALAMDVTRHMKHEPVLARPVTRGERIWRWTRRNPIEAALVVVSAFAALAFVLIALTVRHNAHLRQAYAQADMARIAETQAREREANQRMLVENARVNTERAYAEVERARAEESKQRAVAEAALANAERQIYFRRIAWAEREWLASNVPEAKRLLDECPQELRCWEWHYLKRLCNQELLTFNGHTRSVRAVAFSPDGKRLASGSGAPFGSPIRPDEVNIWDVVTGHSILTLTNRIFAVNGLSFSPNGDRLAIADSAGAKVWDFNTNDSPQLLEGSAGAVASVVFSADERYLAADNSEGSVIIWDAATGHRVRTFTNLASLNVLAFSPDVRRLATASGQPRRVDAGGVIRPETPGEVRLWDLETGKLFLTMNHDGRAGLAVAFSPDRKFVASSHTDRTIIVWDAVTGLKLREINGLADEIYCLVFSPDSQRILTGGADKTLRIWNVSTGQEEFSLRGHGREIHAVAFSPDGKLVASGSDDKTVKIWNMTRDPIPQTVEAKANARINHLAFSKDSKRLAWRADEVYVSDTSTRYVIPKSNSGAGYGKLAFSPEGDKLAVAGKKITLLNTTTGETINQFSMWDEAHEDKAGEIFGIAFSPDGKLIAAGDGRLGGSGSVKIYDVSSAQEIYTLSGHSNGVWDVAFSPNGKRLASASGTLGIDNVLHLRGGTPGEVKIWDLSTQKEIHTLRGHKFCVWSLVFSPDGKRLATASGAYSAKEPGEVKLWDVDSGKDLLTIKGHDECVFSVAFSPDGKRLVSSDGSSGSKSPLSVKVWDSETGEKLLSLSGNQGAIYGVVFSPDGSRIAAGGQDGIIRIWSTERLNN
jgi:WD40 repeat protein/serine/threonine protein kinase